VLAARDTPVVKAAVLSAELVDPPAQVKYEQNCKRRRKKKKRIT
jgi:hypothetical protein